MEVEMFFDVKKAHTETSRKPEFIKPADITKEVQSISSCPVNSFNGWDPLEEVIVGRLEGATIPPAHPSVTFTLPKRSARILGLLSGLRYPRSVVRAAQDQLQGFIDILTAEGVMVRRPAILDGRKPIVHHTWKNRGFCIACPRDGFLVIGDEIIETPMAWRSRFFESYAYRPLFKEYFSQGARWTSAPKPELVDELFDPNYRPPEKGEPMKYLLTEFEPVFDAADFMRCGRDVFAMRSNVTNISGIKWLQRHLGDTYRIHVLDFRCRKPMHIDSSFMPLAPGKLLVNPDYLDVATLPSMFKSWDIIIAPRPVIPNGWLFKFASMTSAWISLNVLMLDEQRVIVEEKQQPLIKLLKDHGFKPIPCKFSDYLPFGGAFHCATLDVRRRGVLQSYF
jgi:glycine amidinotransferase